MEISKEAMKAIRELGRMGGNKTKEIYGHHHFVNVGRKGVNARWDAYYAAKGVPRPSSSREQPAPLVELEPTVETRPRASEVIVLPSSI
jgi:hypothetical protein